ncbi:MAG: hypothetical protein RIR00_2434 [Pseudomonadota bacterium]|jgi:leucyl/phenylalanyl-tRNA--protein transferase
MIPWLRADTPFPPLASALVEPNGLLAAGADLSAMRLLAAYRRGIFPWFSHGQPILWWSPDPRMVVFPAEFRPRRSLRQALRRDNYTIRLDSHFVGVMQACASTPRPGQDGTWISPEMIAAYRQLHELGYAHSVETWAEGELVGGLYGVAIGGMFYGESMFSHRTDASKLAFAHLLRYLRQQGFGLVDCQMKTAHLSSLGGREIPRDEFQTRLTALCGIERTPAPWPQDGACFDWRHATS